MYSPNGTMCRLTYSSPGPVSGSQTIPMFWTWFSPGPYTTAPTSTGTPIAFTAESISS